MARKKHPPKRRQLARERGIVPSSIPAPDRLKRCRACSTAHAAQELRFGYCCACWDSPKGQIRHPSVRRKGSTG